MVPISKRIRKSARQARHQLDQVLLGLSHSSLQKVAKSFTNPDPDDIIARLGHGVLARAGQIRAQLEQFESMAREPKKQIRKITRRPRRALKKAKVKTQRKQVELKKALAKNTARAKSKVKAAVRSRPRPS